jgi:hypothetical protein
MAAISAAVEGLVQRDFDAAIAGGVDRNMGASTYVKFCKIGALSATGTRPYAEGADGFVMGEGAALFLLRRLEDAERDGDRVLAVLRGIGAASDGKGGHHTLILGRSSPWSGPGNAGCRLHGLVRGRYGTSTRVGCGGGEPLRGPSPGHPAGPYRWACEINLGHLKGGGAASLLKTALPCTRKRAPASTAQPRHRSSTRRSTNTSQKLADAGVRGAASRGQRLRLRLFTPCSGSTCPGVRP